MCVCNRPISSQKCEDLRNRILSFGAQCASQSWLLNITHVSKGASHASMPGHAWPTSNMCPNVCPRGPSTFCLPFPLLLPPARPSSHQPPRLTTGAAPSIASGFAPPAMISLLMCDEIWELIILISGEGILALSCPRCYSCLRPRIYQFHNPQKTLKSKL